MKKISLSYICMLAALIIALSSCSSAPKNPGDIYFLRTQAEDGLDSANKEAAKGNFSIALSLLTSFKQNAILTDDMSLIVRICLARGNVLFSLGRIDEAFAEWDHALNEAALFNNAELISISRIFYARGNLLSQKASTQSVLDEVIRESPNLKIKHYIAFSWQVRGLALRDLGLWREAEAAVRQSLAIHEKEKRLENASYDWYIIASIRSLAGDLYGALNALDTSIALDRRIENSWGLASSWRAKGDVLRKDGRETEAVEAYTRARAIYAGMRSEWEAAEMDRRINNN